MPDFLALDWEHRHVCGLDAEVTHGSVRVRKAFALEWPEGKSPNVDAPAAGSWLAEQFASLGLTAKNVLVTLPREEAVVRVLEVPNVPDAELPNVVKFQAASKSARPLDTLRLDFLPLPPRDGVAGREVLVATVGREVLDALSLVLSRTGCELAGVSLTAPAMAELIARLEKSDPPPRHAVELAIVVHEQQVEISLLRDRGLLLTHSARLPDDATTPEREQQAIVAEVNRSLVSLKRQHPELTLSHTWMWGEPAKLHGLASVIRKRFSGDVHVEDPLVLPGLSFDARGDVPSHARFTGPVGLLFGQAGRLAEPLDFLHPRQPIVPRDLRRLWGGVGSATAAALLIGAFGWRWLEVGSLEAETLDHKDKSAQLKQDLDAAAGMIKNVDAIGRWTDQRVSWLDRLFELTEAMQGTDRRYLRKVNCLPGSSGMVGTVRGDGFAKERDDIDDLTSKLSSNEGVSVVPHEQKRDGADGDYPFKFDLDVAWRPVKKKGLGAGGQGSGEKTPPAPGKK
jgi:Tfp pilus assembly PilM family ATPase